jgi:hypothetical protein
MDMRIVPNPLPGQTVKEDLSRLLYVELAMPCIVILPVAGVGEHALFLGLMPSVGMSKNQEIVGLFDWVAEKMAVWAGKHMPSC